MKNPRFPQANQDIFIRAGLRAAIAALRERSAGDAFRPGIMPVAMRVLRDRKPGERHDALVSDYACDLLSAGPGALDALLQLDDSALEAAVYNRLRQLNAQSLPHWNQHRTLRRHVADALEAGEPGEAVRFPGVLQDAQGRWVSCRVREATWALLRTEPWTPRNAAGIASALMRRYGPVCEALDDHGGCNARDVDADNHIPLDDALDAERWVRDLGRAMGPQPLAVFRLSAAGLSVRSIAERMGRNSTWVFRMLTVAKKVLVDFSAAHGLDESNARVITALVAADA